LSVGNIKSMKHAYLLIGGNDGDRVQYLEEAKKLISHYLGKIIKTSSIYETAAWGKTTQPDFLNQVLLVETILNAPNLMNEILVIEKKMGRIRNEKYSQRIIDIDILFYNNEIWQKPELTIPHPEIPNRRFVLEPMNEIAPQLTHPVLKKNIQQLLKECKDELNVKKI
jgi:2-amino-4-hydroxy-6-hydroxymethyldihydropteridine diphosphokinase